MTKMNYTEFLEHIGSMIRKTYFEIGGETWRYNTEKDEWVQNEPLTYPCPNCGQETHVSIRDYNAFVDTVLLVDPEYRTVHVDYSDSKIELEDPGYYCAECGAALPLQSTDEFEEDLQQKTAYPQQ